MGAALGQWGKAPSHPLSRPSLARRCQRIFARSLRILPKSVVKIFASRYIAGETLEEGVTKARALHEAHGIHSTLDVLGEDVRTRAHVEAYHREYRSLIASIADLPFANVSIKLSALGQLLDEEECIERTEDILKRAAEVGTFVRFDMEDHTTTDSTLRIYRTLRERGYTNLGVVLQSRLFRTTEDLEDLAELKPNVRLCIGIYREPPEIALQEKPAMKRRMLELLEGMWANSQHVALATHEEWCIREALTIAERMHISKPEIEVQMLLGVPSLPLQKELIAQGIRVRLYVPYGRQWYAYSMRRLENNPDVFLSVLKSLIRSIFHRGSN
jgi:proline dehydrogenase